MTKSNLAENLETDGSQYENFTLDYAVLQFYVSFEIFWANNSWSLQY